MKSFPIIKSSIPANDFLLRKYYILLHIGIIKTFVLHASHKFICLKLSLFSLFALYKKIKFRFKKKLELTQKN